MAVAIDAGAVRVFFAGAWQAPEIQQLPVPLVQLNTGRSRGGNARYCPSPAPSGNSHDDAECSGAQNISSHFMNALNFCTEFCKRNWKNEVHLEFRSVLRAGTAGGWADHSGAGLWLGLHVPLHGREISQQHHYCCVQFQHAESPHR